MALNHYHWTRVFRGEFSKQLAAIVDVLETRLLPGFAGIDEEAEAVSEQAWESFMSGPGTGDEDPGDFAEAAQEAGIAHYLLLDGIRQGTLNLFAAALYHAFEQQILFFHRKQVLLPKEENDPRLFEIRTFCARLRNLGIDITQFGLWPKVQELKLVANTVKHAEGDSAQRLHAARPDLFVHPQAGPVGMAHSAQTVRVFQPLIGDDLYLSLRDVKEYRDSLLAFWKELSEALVTE
jgi:hypothetical protein